MGDKSAIEWTDATWNPWQGCHKVSPGCNECYMFREKLRYGQEPNVVVRSKPRTFTLPLRLNQPQRVFTCSWSDFFIREADPWRAEAWAIIDRTRHLTYQILTKRIERVAALLPWGSGAPWSHVQIIASVENQEQADRRISRLLALNVAVRGVSYEPALGPVRLPWIVRGTVGYQDGCGKPDGEPWFVDGDGVRWSAYDVTVKGIDWLVAGGESGPGARPPHPDWFRSARDQCVAAGIPFFFKQWGEWAPHPEPPTPGRNNGAELYVLPNGRYGDQGNYWRGEAAGMNRVGKHAGGRELDGRTWDEFPDAVYVVDGRVTNTGDG